LQHAENHAFEQNNLRVISGTDKITAKKRAWQSGFCLAKFSKKVDSYRKEQMLKDCFSVDYNF